jgi:hypothetical protein
MSNYLRPPSKWITLSENLEKLGNQPVKTIHGSIATTISVYNILHFLDISRWLLEKNFKRIKRIPSYHMLEGPDYMSVQVLPSETKEYIKEQYEIFYKEVDAAYSTIWGDWFRTNYQGIINYMFSEDKSYLLPKLKYSTTKLDNLRGNDLAVQIEWLAKILGE